MSKQAPNPDKFYKPTNLFSGNGFSQTSDLKRHVDWNSSSAALGSNPIWTPTSTDPVDDRTFYRGRSRSRNFNNSDGFAQASSNMPRITETMFPVQSNAFEKVDLSVLLREMGLSQYAECFDNVKLTQFLSMTEEDLILVGVNTTPARYKFLTLIMQMRAMLRFTGHSSTTSSDIAFQAAPGAERPNKRE
jgi:hypothetical protein